MATKTNTESVAVASAKAEINAYSKACATVGLMPVEVPCMLASETPDGDPKLYCEGRIYNDFAVSNGYCIPVGEATVGQPPKVRYIAEGQPRIAMHWRKG